VELPASGYFYALAQLSMAFVGFSAIVVALRQGTGKPLSAFHIFLTRVFIELGLMAAAFGMLAPTLALSGRPETPVWRISSAIMLAVLAPWLLLYPIRRKATMPDGKFPIRVYVMIALGIAILVALCLNAVGLFINPGPVALAMATAYVLFFASVASIATYTAFLRD